MHLCSEFKHLCISISFVRLSIASSFLVAAKLKIINQRALEPEWYSSLVSFHIVFSVVVFFRSTSFAFFPHFTARELYALLMLLPPPPWKYASFRYSLIVYWLFTWCVAIEVMNERCTEKRIKFTEKKKSIAIYSIHTLIHYFYAALVLFAIELPKLKCNEKKMEKKKRKKKEERMKTKNTLLYVVQIPDVLGVGVIAAHSSRCAKQANDLRAFADVSDDGTEKKEEKEKSTWKQPSHTHSHDRNRLTNFASLPIYIIRFVNDISFGALFHTNGVSWWWGSVCLFSLTRLRQTMMHFQASRPMKSRKKWI